MRHSAWALLPLMHELTSKVRALCLYPAIIRALVLLSALAVFALALVAIMVSVVITG